MACLFLGLLVAAQFRVSLSVCVCALLIDTKRKREDSVAIERDLAIEPGQLKLQGPRTQWGKQAARTAPPCTAIIALNKSV